MNPLQIPFPLSRLIQSAPEPIVTPIRDRENGRIARGRYLAPIASSIDCPTPEDKMHRPIRGMESPAESRLKASLRGAPTSRPIRAEYLTYDEDLFIRVMRMGHVGARALNPPLPWWVFRNMRDDDLKSIFAYLPTVKPIHHRIDNSEIASR